MRHRNVSRIPHHHLLVAVALVAKVSEELVFLAQTMVLSWLQSPCSMALHNETLLM